MAAPGAAERRAELIIFGVNDPLGCDPTGATGNPQNAQFTRAGMPWTVAGADAIIALRGGKLSGRFEDFWERRSATAAAGAR